MLSVTSVRVKAHYRALFTKTRKVKKKRVTGLLGTVMSNRNAQWLNAFLLLTERRNKVHPPAEDEWVDAVIETAAYGKSKFEFQDAEIALGKMERNLLSWRSVPCSEIHWVLMTSSGFRTFKGKSKQRKPYLFPNTTFKDSHVFCPTETHGGFCQPSQCPSARSCLVGREKTE